MFVCLCCRPCTYAYAMHRDIPIPTYIIAHQWAAFKNRAELLCVCVRARLRMCMFVCVCANTYSREHTNTCSLKPKDSHVFKHTNTRSDTEEWFHELMYPAFMHSLVHVKLRVRVL